jgi:hypothetical protein
MDLLVKDFNDVAKAMVPATEAAWKELEGILKSMPLHVKASDQDGIQGKAIFDPVGTNEFVKSKLQQLPRSSWQTNVPIPSQYDFLGTDVDFVNQSLLVEAQFSNYPFLLNNVVRSELFVKGGVLLSTVPIKWVVIITKAHVFPASNSTLYYEQADKQLQALAAAKVFDVPIRLVGLSATVGHIVPGTWTDYAASRYSRTVVKRKPTKLRVMEPKTRYGRATLTDAS